MATTKQPKQTHIRGSSVMINDIKEYYKSNVLDDIVEEIGEKLFKVEEETEEEDIIKGIWQSINYRTQYATPGEYPANTFILFKSDTVWNNTHGNSTVEWKDNVLTIYMANKTMFRKAITSEKWSSWETILTNVNSQSIIPPTEEPAKEIVECKMLKLESVTEFPVEGTYFGIVGDQLILSINGVKSEVVLVPVE